MSRWFRFFLVLLLGIAAGLFYGWEINPVEYVDTTPDTLRIDYKTDYVLMVAEIFRVEEDVDKAARRLALLGDASPEDLVLQSILFAESLNPGYTDADLAQMRALSDALHSWQVNRETLTP